jgi:hypothetical protein
MVNPLEQDVRDRAGGLCEYCHLPEAFQRLPFQMDHIIAEQHGGQMILENLANSCLRCNKRKGPNIAGIDATTGEVVRLFHPRRDRWEEHFAWHGATLVGLTPIARATIAVLAINHPSAVAVRVELIEEGVFPPPSATPGPG